MACILSCLNSERWSPAIQDLIQPVDYMKHPEFPINQERSIQTFLQCVHNNTCSLQALLSSPLKKREVDSRNKENSKVYVIWSHFLLSSCNAPAKMPLSGKDVSNLFILQNIKTLIQVQCLCSHCSPLPGILFLLGNPPTYCVMFYSVFKVSL